MYFDEDLVLEIRLNTLYDIVDKFVILEAKQDHAGNNKQLNFKIENFKNFEDKIQYIVVENLSNNKSFNKKYWHENHARDQFQRDCLSQGYDDCLPEDLIMISDIDEIPNPKKIKEFNIKNMYACFLQRNYQSKLNLLNVTNNLWPGTKICQKKNLKSPQWLRNIKTKQVPFWKFYREKQPQLIKDGGWHFSFLKTPKEIKKKIESYSHQEFNNESFTDTNNIEKRIFDGKDLFDRNIEYKKVELDHTYPEYILQNKDILLDWII